MQNVIFHVKLLSPTLRGPQKENNLIAMMQVKDATGTSVIQLSLYDDIRTDH